ncbi:hypothetical protein BGX33_001850, partial [Mortierella sp. NVP41]
VKTTAAAPLVIADGSHTIYEEFISDLNLETMYELGLRGTANSKLDLGALGIIEIKGIPLDVKTTMAGLQGLKQIDFKTNIATELFNDGKQLITSVVNIHNPSQLTLKIGDMSLYAGLDYVAENHGAVSVIRDLVLVPGDNNVLSALTLDSGTPAGLKIALGLIEGPVKMTLFAFPGSTSNPALNSGLMSLRSEITVPKEMAGPPSAPAFNREWTIKVPPTTVDDGFVEMTTTFNNPFYGLDYTQIYGSALPSENLMAYDPSSTTIEGRSLFGFERDFKFSFKGNESRAISYKMKLLLGGDIIDSTYKKVISDLVAFSAGKTAIEMDILWTPVILVATEPTPLYPFYANVLYEGQKLILNIGPDFLKIGDYYEKVFGGNSTVLPPPPVVPPVPSPVVSPVVPTTMTVAPVTSSALPSPSPPPSALPSASSTLSPSPSPVVVPSPIAPSA